MTDYKCPNCKTVWKGAKPVQKHLIFDESKHQTLHVGRATCTCSVGEDGLIAQ